MAKNVKLNWERQEFWRRFPMPETKAGQYCRIFGHQPMFPDRAESPCRNCDAILTRNDMEVPTAEEVAG